MVALRRLFLIAALVGSVLGGYVFSAGTATSHAMPARQLADECGGGPIPC